MRRAGVFLLSVKICYASRMNISLGDMEKVAQEIVASVLPLSDNAHVIALSGNLGAGKTTLVQHIARILGITETVTSPTFVLMKQYPVQHHTFTQLVHIDAYRLEKPEELHALRINSIFSDPGNLVIIEWPEHVASVLPAQKTTIVLTVASDVSRDIDIRYATDK